MRYLLPKDAIEEWINAYDRKDHMITFLHLSDFLNS